MILRGINGDVSNPYGAPSFDAVYAFGFNAIRLASTRSQVVETYAAAFRKAGGFVLDAITGQANGHLLEHADLHQIHNEIDIQTPSSEGVIPPEDYVGRVYAWAGTYSDRKFILGSLAAGDYSATYLRAILPVLKDPVLSNVIGFSLHPYDKSLADTKTLIAAHQQACRDVLGRELPVFITEWNRPAGEIPGYDWWLRQNTAGGFWFCWSEGMVAGLGLVKNELSMFHPFITPPVPTPPPPTPAPMVVQIPSPNHWAGRPSGAPIGLVIHTMAGSLGATDGWFSNPASQVSAHYGIGLNGDVHQYVQTHDRAWANGILEPGNQWPGPGGVNPNDLTISIETEDLGNNDQPVTDAQYAHVLAMCRQALTQYPAIRYLLGHHAISPQTRAHCPGNRWIQSGRFAQLAADLGLKAIP